MNRPFPRSTHVPSSALRASHRETFGQGLHHEDLHDHVADAVEKNDGRHILDGGAPVRLDVEHENGPAALAKAPMFDLNSTALSSVARSSI